MTAPEDTLVSVLKSHRKEAAENKGGEAARTAASVSVLPASLLEDAGPVLATAQSLLAPEEIAPKVCTLIRLRTVHCILYTVCCILYTVFIYVQNVLRVDMYTTAVLQRVHLDVGNDSGLSCSMPALLLLSVVYFMCRKTRGR